MDSTVPNSGTPHPPEEDPVLLTAAAFEAAPDGILILDEHGVIVGLNASARRMFGRNNEDTIGRELTELLAGHTRLVRDFFSRPIGQTTDPIVLGRTRNFIGLHLDRGAFPMHMNLAEANVSDTRLFIAVCRAPVRQDSDAAERSYRAEHDSLTGCLNREAFHSTLSDMMRAASEQDGAVALLFIDLNDFKDVNDGYGHAVGDALLGRIVERFRSVLRDGDAIGRLGGDEFAVAVPLTSRIAPADTARDLAERLTASLLGSFYLDGAALKASACVGIAIAPTHAQNADDLLHRADIAMYAAKNEAIRVRVYDDALQRSFDSDRKTLQQVRDAIDAGSFELHYQPLVDLARNTPVDIESLVRMRAADGRLMPPDEFLPIVTRYAHMADLTGWVAMQVSAEYARVVTRVGEGARLCINVPLSVLETGGFSDSIRALLFGSELPLERLELEITESEHARDLDTARENMLILRQQGVTFSLDDFGMGRAGLALVRALPISRVKLDWSFADALDTQRGRDVVRGVARLARELRISLLVEGIETEEQRDALIELGVSQGQGPLFGAPLPVDELSEWCGFRETVR